MNTAQDRLNDMIRKVEALMRKAERTTVAAEADAFFAKAQELMTKHGIDEAMIRAEQTEIPAEKVISDNFLIKRSGFFEAMVRLALACADANDVRVLIRTPKDWGQSAGVRFIGMESDVSKTKMLYISLLAQSIREAQRDCPGYLEGHARGKWRRDHRLGFAARIGARLREIKRATIDEAARTDGRFLPVLADRKVEVAKVYDAQASGTWNVRSRSGPDPEAWNAGQSAANRADLGQPRAGRGTAGALPR